MSTDFPKIIVKHLHFLHRENETKLYVRKIFFSAQTKGALIHLTPFEIMLTPKCSYMYEDDLKIF